jgi:hypothetical protein
MASGGIGFDASVSTRSQTLVREPHRQIRQIEGLPTQRVRAVAKELNILGHVKLRRVTSTMREAMT